LSADIALPASVPGNLDSPDGTQRGRSAAFSSRRRRGLRRSSPLHRFPS
jgi:hypothetical protein